MSKSEIITRKNKNIFLNFSNRDLNKYLNESRNKISNKRKFYNNPIKSRLNNNQAKTIDLTSKNNDNEINVSIEENVTSKIDYRHFKNYPIKEILPLKQLDETSEELYWLLTYDKLIKSKNIIKILNSNNNYSDKNKLNSFPIYTESSFKTKTLKIPKFEVFFVEGYDKPFMKPSKNKNSFIYAKLYLLTIKEINKIFNFINRTEDKINIDKFINLAKRKSYEYIYFKNSSDNNIDINYPYCYIYYAGKFMNISMLFFTNTFNYVKSYQINHINNMDNSLNIIYSLPSSKKLYKLIKTIIKTFPDDEPEDIINNVICNDLYLNSKEKKNEVKKYFSLLKHSVPNKLLLNKVLRETITGIQTNSSISKFSNNVDSKDISDKIKQNNKIINLKNYEYFIYSKKESKSDFNSSIHPANNFFFNGRINYLSTNHTTHQSNSIRTVNNKNSKVNNFQKLIISNNSNNIKKNKNKNLYINSKDKNKIKEKIIFKSKNKFIIDENNKENIDTSNLFNNKIEDNIFRKKLGKKNIKNDLIKNKTYENIKGNKYFKNIEYLTPKKKKIIKYYK